MIDGLVEPGFGGVADALGANLERRGDVGAACCVYLDGRPVVDIWAGIADAATGRPWQDDTLALVFSTTKGATAVCANLLIERGVARSGPAGRRRVARVRRERQGRRSRSRRALHRAGLPVVEGDFTLEPALAWDPGRRAARDASRRAGTGTSPSPGTTCGRTAGSIGEIVRRVTGRTIGHFFAEEIAAPLGLDWWIGLPESEEPRCRDAAAARRRPRTPRSAS